MMMNNPAYNQFIITNKAGPANSGAKKAYTPNATGGFNNFKAQAGNKVSNYNPLSFHTVDGDVGLTQNEVNSYYSSAMNAQ